MKKFLLIILSILLISLPLTSCSKDNKDGNVNGSNDNNSISKKNNNESEKETIEQTNKELNLRYVLHQKPIFDNAITIFKKTYPDVKVNIDEVKWEDNMQPDELMTKLSADIMAGSGPDILYMDFFTYDYTDVHKMMMSGVFADLNKFFEKDADFKIDDFNKTVFNGGILNDKRYIIPLSYKIPVALTTESIVKEKGIDIAKCNKFSGITDEITKQLNNKQMIFGRPNVFNQYYKFMGIKMLDYANQTVNVDSDEFKKTAEFYKLLYPQDSMEKVVGNADLLKEKGKILEFENRNFLSSYFIDMMAIKAFDKCVVLPINDTKGGLQAEITNSLAVRNNTPNKQNAYNFIKIMLSEEVMDKNQTSNIPVRNSSIKKYCKMFTIDTEITETSEQPLKLITENEIDEFIKLSQNVTDTYINSPWSKKFDENMKPFYEGKKSYEECIKKAKDEMKIYISE